VNFNILIGLKVRKGCIQREVAETKMFVYFGVGRWRGGVMLRELTNKENSVVARAALYKALYNE
jgi:hypothetical protein